MTYAKYRKALPIEARRTLLTDGGLETTLIFLDGYDLPCFASFDLMRTQDGRTHLKEYFVRYARLAQHFGVGMMLDTPTWRAQQSWGSQLGYDAHALDVVNAECVEMMQEIRSEYETPEQPFIISGNMGPRGDGYVVTEAMTSDEARDYHAAQVNSFAAAGADLVSFFTVNYVEEAIGFVRAAQNAGLPSVVSFTVETDGKLPTGQTLESAILQVEAETGKGPAHYMINCAHPTHFSDAVSSGANWLKRIGGVRANASAMSHEELDNSTELDAGNPIELADQYKELMAMLPNLVVLGGCCGTDHRHVEAIGHACIGHTHDHTKGRVHAG